MYAILSHGGRQYRVTAGDRLIVDRLTAEVGDVVALEPVLFTAGDGDAAGFGGSVDGVRVAATVIAHRRGRKLRIFKYKAKKRSRKVAGYRSNLTELRVESILAKGAALPEPAAAAVAVAAETVEAAPAPARRRGRAAAAATTAAPEADAASTEPVAATSVEPVTATSEASAEAASEASEAAPAAKPKRSTRARKPSADHEESGDGA